MEDNKISIQNNSVMEVEPKGIASFKPDYAEAQKSLKRKAEIRDEMINKAITDVKVKDGPKDFNPKRTEGQKKMYLSESLFDDTLITIEDKYNYLKQYPLYNGKYTRLAGAYDLGLSKEQLDRFFEFLEDGELETFWNVNELLSQGIYQEGRIGKHLVLDPMILKPTVFEDFDTFEDYYKGYLDDNYYPDNEDDYSKTQKEDAFEEVSKEINDSYITLKDFDDRVNELIELLKKSLDNNKAVNESIKSKAKKIGGSLKEDHIANEHKTKEDKINNYLNEYKYNGEGWVSLEKIQFDIEQDETLSPLKAEDVINYATHNGWRITLTQDDDFGLVSK